MVCCVETVGQSKTRQQVGSTFYLNHSAAGQRAALKTTHVISQQGKGVSEIKKEFAMFMF